jgi:hypothetical protein
MGVMPNFRAVSAGAIPPPPTRDALTNTFREFWPDIAVHVLHRHP